MTLNIPTIRLQNQQLINSPFEKPEEVVAWFGAIQAQDFAAAKWAIGLRSKDQTDTSIEQAFNEGKILRTHILRPTWHFVSPKDIRWMLALTSPRVHAFNGHYYRKSGLTKDIFQKSNDIIQNTLQGGKQLTREELQKVLEQKNIPVKNMSLTYTMLQAELDGIICSGPRIEKQFTYMLVDERVPKIRKLERDEALGELTKRYFQSHGSAQIQDFCWWSSLTAIDAKRGVAIAKLKKEIINNKEYWFTEDMNQQCAESAELIPPFDEYFVAYKDRSDILDKRYSREMNFGGGMIVGAIIVNGIVIGTWKRTFAKKQLMITLKPFTKFGKKEYKNIVKAAEKYGKFHGLPIEIQ